MRPLVLDDHRRLGCELKAMRDRLVEIAVKLGRSYDPDNRIVIVVERSWREIDELRSALDKDLFNKYTSVPGIELMQIYYPRQNQHGDDHGR